MSSVDNRIVNMEFNNAQFEAGIAQSVDSLKKLDDSLNLKNAQVGLEQVQQAANRLNVSNIAHDVDDLRDRFSNLGIVGMTALSNIANRAVNVGIGALRKTFIDPVMQGFNELELKNKSIQTIFANTEAYGTTMDDISSSLDELNHYADKTIYNFAQMTDNIGKFTAAGVDLETSVTGIKGLANLGAFSGATNSNVQRAMYQMSQALATGTIKLLDWNSLVQSGMGGMEFQNDLKRTARHFGIDVDAMIEKTGSFRESLKEGWLTNEVFLESLNHFATDANEWAGGLEGYKNSLREAGWSNDDIDAIVRLGNTATEAATKVRSASQLLETVQEEVGSGWATTFDLLLGGFEGATEIFSAAYDRLSPILSGQGLFRNAALQSWINMGGRNTLLTGLGTIADSAFKMIEGVGDQLVSVFGLKSAIEAFKSGQSDLISAIGSTHLGQLLFRMSDTIGDFAKQIQLSEGATQNWGKIWDGVFSIMDIGIQTVGMLANGFFQVMGALSPIGEIIMAVLGPLGDAIRGFRDWFLSLDPFMKFTQFIKTVTTPVHDFLQMIADALNGVANFADLGNIVRNGLGMAGKAIAGGAGMLLNFLTGGQSFGQMISGAFGSASEVATQVKNSSFVRGMVTGVQTGFKGARDYIMSFYKDVNSLSSFGTAFGNMSRDMFQSFRNNVPAVDWAIDHIKSGFNSMYDYVKPYFYGADSIGDYLTGFKNMAADLASVVHDKFTAMNTDGSGLWADFKNGFSKAASYMVVKLREVPGKFRTAAQNIGFYLSSIIGNGKIGTTFSGMFEGLTQPFGKVVEFVKSKAGEFGSNLKEFVSHLDLIQTIKTGAQGFGGGIIEFLQNLSEAAKNFIPGIIDWFDDFFTRIFVKFHNEDTNMGIFDRIGTMIEKGAQNLGGKLQSAGSNIKQAFTDITDFVVSGEGLGAFKDIPWEDISMIGETLAMIAFVHQTNKMLGTLSAAVKQLGDTLASLGGGVSGSFKLVGKSIAGFIDSYAGIGKSISTAITTQSKWAGITAFMKALVPVLLEVAGLAGIAMVDGDALWQAVGVVGAVSAILMAVMAVGNKIGSAKFNPGRLMSLAPTMIAFAAAVSIIAGSLSKVAGIDTDDLVKGGIVVGAIGTFLVVCMKVLTNASFSTKKLSTMSYKAGFDTLLALIGFAITVRAIAGSLKTLGNMEWGTLGRGILGMSVVMGSLTALSYAMGKFGGSGVKFKTNFRSMAALILGVVAIAAVLKPLANMDTGELIQGVLAVGAIITELFAGMGSISAVGGGFNVGGILALSAALIVLTGSIKALGKMDTGALVQGLFGIAAALGVLVGAAALVSLMGTSLDHLGNILLKFSGAALMFAAAMALIVGAVGTMDTLIRTLSLNNSSLGELIGQILSGLIDGLEMIGSKLVDALARLFIESIETLGKYIGRLVKALVNLFVQVIDALGDALPEIFSHIKGFADKFGKAFVDTFGEVDWGAVGEDLADIIWTPIGAAIAAKLTKVGVKDIAKVALAIALTVGPLVAAMTVLSAYSNQNGVDALNAINNTIGVVGALVALAAMVPGNIATFATAGVGLGIGVDAFLGVVGGLQALAGGLDMLLNGGLVSSLERGKEVFQLIGEALGSVVGGFAGGVAASFTDSLPRIGDNLSEFVSSIDPFVSGVNKIGDKGIERIQSLFVALSTIPMEGGIFTAFTGSRSNTLAALNALLPGLGEGIGEFANSVKNVNFDKIGPAFEAVASLATFANNLPQSSQWNLMAGIFGRKQTLSEFAEGLSDFFNEMRAAVNQMGPGEDLDTSGFEKAIEAAKKLVELQNELPDFQGPSVMSFFFGDKQTLIEFAQGMCAWKTQLKTAIDEFGSGDDLDVSGFEKGVEVTKKLVAVAKDLPPAGSLAGAIFGGNIKSLSEFANEIGDLFSTLSDIDWHMPDFEGINDNPKLDRVSTLVTNMAYAASLLPPTTGGILSFKSVFTDLKDTLPEIRAAMEEIGKIELNSDQLSKIPQISTGISTLARAQKSVITSLGDVEPGEDISDKVTALSQFVNSLVGDDSTFVSDIQKIALAAGEMTGQSLENLESISGTIETLADVQAKIEESDIRPTGGTAGGKLTALATDAAGMAEGLAALASFATVAGDDITGRGMRTNQAKIDALAGIIPQIQALADVYATLAGASVPGTMTIAPDAMLTQFSTGLKQLGPALRGLYTNVTDVNEAGGGVTLDKDRMTEITDMVSSLGDLVTNGALKDFDSSKLSDFSTSLTDSSTGLGPALKSFYEMVNDINGEGEGDLKIDKNRITEIVDSVGEIAKLGGAEGVLKDFDAAKISDFTAVVDGTLGENLGAFFAGIFSSDFEFDQAKIDSMLGALTSLSSTFVDLPPIDESVKGKITIFGDCLKSLLTAFGGGSDKTKGATGLFMAMNGATEGATDMGGFMVVVSQLGTFAKGLTEVANAVAAIPDVDPSVVETFTTTIQSLVDAFGGGQSEGAGLGAMGMGLGTFGSKAGGVDFATISSNIVLFAGAMTQLGSAMSSVSGLTSAEGGGSLDMLVLSFQTMSQIDFQTLATNVLALGVAFAVLSPGLTALGDGSGITSFANALLSLQSLDLSGLPAQVQALAAAISGDLVAAFLQVPAQISAASTQVVAAVLSMCVMCIAAIQQTVPQFQSVGVQTGQGFAAGIISQAGAASSAALVLLSAATSSIQGGYGAFFSAGASAASGFSAGIMSQAASAASAAASMVSNAIAAAKAAQKSASPSKVYMEIGRWAVQGYAEGIESEGDTASKAIRQVIGSSIHEAYLLAAQDMTASPLITPVVDITDVENKARQINGMIAGSFRLKMNGTAVALAGGIAARVEVPGYWQPRSGFGDNVTNNYSMIQNNTSPKALSRLDIYRDTRNLFSQLKQEAVK